MGDKSSRVPAAGPAVDTRLSDRDLGAPRLAAPPAGRYGPPARNRVVRRRLLLGALFTVFAAVVVMLAWDYAKPGVSSSLTSFQLGADKRSVTVRFTVHKPKDKSVSCVVEATDRDHNPVGQTEVRIGPGATDVDKTVLLRTTAPPDNGQLGDCSISS